MKMSALNEARRLKGALPALSVTTMIYFTVGKNLEKTHKKYFFKDNCLMLSKWKYYINITRKTHYRTRFFLFLGNNLDGSCKRGLETIFLSSFQNFFPTVQYNQPTRTSTVFWNSWNFFSKSCWKECWNQSHFFTN